MSTITFDTLKFARTLQDAGIADKQADAITTAFKAAVDDQELATKQDLTLAIETVRKEIAETKAELVRWIIGAGFLQSVLIAALLLKLMK